MKTTNTILLTTTRLQTFYWNIISKMFAMLTLIQLYKSTFILVLNIKLLEKSFARLKEQISKNSLILFIHFFPLTLIIFLSIPTTSSEQHHLMKKIESN